MDPLRLDRNTRSKFLLIMNAKLEIIVDSGQGIKPKRKYCQKNPKLDLCCPKPQTTTSNLSEFFVTGLVTSFD
ncbi:hypothetical protein A4A49_39557 [Nicotiana attenuata]|uniref:Uncharacterized protein n=1 Tax=Nicotiana attenuata TaxID=49451 RepID=A0A1J6KAW0_NICAT|nr:hypothetical protein A4A49_39557 [Nicotiana attenuata]